MSVEFLHPLRLLAIPVCMLAVFLICRFRRSRSRKERISHGLRYVLILLAALALAGMSLKTASPDRTAFLLVDVSASVNEEETVRLAKEALAEAGERKTGVIAFGADAAVLRSPGQEAPLDVSEAQADCSGTDLYGALQMASALLPEDSNGGIAVISDGLMTGEENLLPAAGGLPVNVLKTDTRSGADAQVTSVTVPSSLYTGQKYTTQVTVHSNTAGKATLLLTRDQGAAESREVTLRRGENTFAFDSTAAGAGVSTVEARVLMAGDSVSANDSGAAYTVIAGEPSVLIAEGQFRTMCLFDDWIYGAGEEGLVRYDADNYGRDSLSGAFAQFAVNVDRRGIFLLVDGAAYSSDASVSSSGSSSGIVLLQTSAKDLLLGKTHLIGTIPADSVTFAPNSYRITLSTDRIIVSSTDGGSVFYFEYEGNGTVS